MISPFLKLRLSHSCKKITSGVLRCQTRSARAALLQGRIARRRIQKSRERYTMFSSAEPINKTMKPLRQPVFQRDMMSADRKPLRVADLHSLHFSASIVSAALRKGRRKADRKTATGSRANSLLLLHVLTYTYYLHSLHACDCFRHPDHLGTSAAAKIRTRERACVDSPVNRGLRHPEILAYVFNRPGATFKRFFLQTFHLLLTYSRTLKQHLNFFSGKNFNSSQVPCQAKLDYF